LHVLGSVNMQTLQAYFHWTLSSHISFVAATRLLRNHKTTTKYK